MREKNRRRTVRGKSKKPAKGKPHGSWTWRPLRIALSLAVVIFLVILFSQFSNLHKFQNLILDTNMSLSDAPTTTEVAIVKITDEDYRGFFEGKSPLDPSKLQWLINAISKGKPKLIGVDIDTSAPQFSVVQIGRDWPPIIWSREPKEVPQTVLEKTELLDVLGGKDRALNANSGIPFLIEDPEDKVTRRYRRLIETTEGLMPSFSWAVARQALAKKQNNLEASQEDFYIRFYNSQKGMTIGSNFPASTILELSMAADPSKNHPLKDKIVLLGGAYLGQDLHDTPVGRMNGVEIIGQVVETELQGGGDKAHNKLYIILLEIFEGVIVIFLFQFFHKAGFLKALMMNLLTLFLLAVVCSYMAFGIFGGWKYFAPLLILILLYEFIVEYRGDLVKTLWNSLFGASPNAH